MGMTWKRLCREGDQDFPRVEAVTFTQWFSPPGYVKAVPSRQVNRRYCAREGRWCKGEVPLSPCSLPAGAGPVPGEPRPPTLWCSHCAPFIRASRIYFCLGGGLQIGIATGKKRVSGGVWWAQRGLPGPFFGWCCHLGCESAKASLQTEDPQAWKTFHSVFPQCLLPKCCLGRVCGQPGQRSQRLLGQSSAWRLDMYLVC